MTTTSPTPNWTSTLLRDIATQQAHVLGTVAGLSDDQLATSTVPSGWTFAGMLQHLGVGTRFWLHTVLLGEPEEQCGEDFVVPRGTPGRQTVTSYADVVADTQIAVAHLPVDAAPAWWPTDGRWGPWRLPTLGDVLLHVLYETTTHAGHLDVARELLDGGRWDVATGSVSLPQH